MCAHKTRLPVFLTNSNLRRKQLQKNKGVRFRTGLSFRQALVVLGWVSCASSAQKRGLGKVYSMPRAHRPIAEGMPRPRAHVKSVERSCHVLSLESSLPGLQTAPC